MIMSNARNPNCRPTGKIEHVGGNPSYSNGFQMDPFCGNAISIGLFASPLPTFWRIFKRRSTEDFSGLPYVATLMNCLLWVLYGLPLVTKNALLVLTINVAGCAIETFYLVIFVRYASKAERKKVVKVLSACVSAFALVAALTLKVVPRRVRQIEVGSICVAVGVAMYVSPLSVMKMVIKTRSVEFMPLLLCICVFLNSTVWTGYGVLALDKFIIIPNALGMIAGVVQLSLHIIYRKTTPLRGAGRVPLRSSNDANGDPPTKRALSGSDNNPRSHLGKMSSSVADGHI